LLVVLDRQLEYLSIFWRQILCQQQLSFLDYSLRDHFDVEPEEKKQSSFENQQIDERTISSLASLIAVKAKTKTSGKMVVIGANELICGIS